MLFSQNIDPNGVERRRFFLLRWLLAGWYWLVPPTVAHQDRQSASARLIARWTMIALCVGAMGVTAYFARPIHGQYKVWRAGHLIEEARQAREGGDVVKALLTAQKAVSMSPDFEPAVRMNAELLTMVSQDQAMYFWDRLAVVGTVSLEDEMGRVRALLRIHRDKEAAAQLEGLLKGHPGDVRLMKLGEEVWGKLQSGGVLMRVLEQYVKGHPEDRESKLRLLKLQNQSHGSEPAAVAAGLWTLAEGTDQAGLDALRMLAEINTLTSPELERLADGLEKHPLAEESDRAKVLGIRVELRPGRKNQYIDEAIARTRDFKPDKLLPLVRWLGTHGEPGRVLTMLSENDVKRDEALLNNYLNALTSLGRTAELTRLVNDPTVTLRATTRTFYQAHLALVQGEPREEVRRKLHLVLQDLKTGGQGDGLLLLGKYSQDREFYDIAEEALETAAMSTRAYIERSGFASWIECCKISGNTDGLAKATLEASRRWPDDQSFMENYLYAKLLQGDQIETSLNRAELLLSANPKDSSRKLLAALAYWRMGDTERSVAACQGINLSTVTPGQQAVFALIVHDAGPLPVTQGDEQAFKDSLRSIISPIPSNARMLPEEAAMLRRASL